MSMFGNPQKQRDDLIEQLHSVVLMVARNAPGICAYAGVPGYTHLLTKPEQKTTSAEIVSLTTKIYAAHSRALGGPALTPDAFARAKFLATMVCESYPDFPMTATFEEIEAYVKNCETGARMSGSFAPGGYAPVQAFSLAPAPPASGWKPKGGMRGGGGMGGPNSGYKVDPKWNWLGRPVASNLSHLPASLAPKTPQQLAANRAAREATLEQWRAQSALRARKLAAAHAAFTAAKDAGKTDAQAQKAGDDAFEATAGGKRKSRRNMRKSRKNMRKSRMNRYSF